MLLSTTADFLFVHLHGLDVYIYDHLGAPSTQSIVIEQQERTPLISSLLLEYRIFQGCRLHIYQTGSLPT